MFIPPILFVSLFAGIETHLVVSTLLNPMAIADVQEKNSTETSHSTKRVFMRAEHEDVLSIASVSLSYKNEDLPKTLAVLKREMTYFGPKLRVEDQSTGNQYLLTIPGPKSEALLWSQSNSDWESLAQVSVEFVDSYSQYDICLYCNEPLSTVEHRRRSVIGVCSDS